MKRVALVVVLFVFAAAIPAAQAHKGHARPQITRFEFVDRPLKSGMLERLVVVAHDPNSWISEIQVQWEDENESGGVIFAHTYCVQDPEFRNPGTPAKLKLDVTFQTPGRYHVEVRAISEKRCEGGIDTRFSRTLEKDVVVRDAHEAFADADDAQGPLDVVIAEQTQVSDDAGLDNHIVHSVVMSEDLGATPLAGADDYVQLFFDTDDISSTFERTLTIDSDGGALRATMTDASGNEVGEATATSDGASLSVDFLRRFLKRGLERYRWYALTHDSSSAACADVACDDRTPDTGTHGHRL